MNKFARRAGTLLLSAAVLSTSVFGMTACKGKKAKASKIGDDDPWFDVSTTELGSQYDPSEYDYFYQYVQGNFGGNIIVEAYGSKPIPPDFDWEHGDYSQFEVDNLDVYSENGDFIKTLDAKALLVDAGYPEASFYSIDQEGDLARISFGTWDEATFEPTEYTAILDIDTETLSEVEEVNDEDGSMNSEGTDIFDGYNISRYYIAMNNMGNEASYLFRVTKDGETYDIDLREELPNQNVWDTPGLIYVGDGKAVLPFAEDPGAKCDQFIMIDLEARTAEMYNEDMSWYESPHYARTFYNEAGEPLIVDEDGIKKINFAGKSMDTVFDFGYSNVNRSDIQYMQLLSATDDRIVFTGTIWRDMGAETTATPTIVVFERAASNPNAGKTVIEAAVVTYIDRATAEAVCRFNETNPDYFIRYTMKYNLDKFVENTDVNNNNDYEQRELDTGAAMSNQLAMDLMSGDGPDIIFNTLSYSQLNNADYLVDLSDQIDPSGYFANIFDACKTQDKLFQIPLNFTLEGITTSGENLADGQHGFTFDQYPEFVDTVCNGEDPIEKDKLGTFTALLANMSDLFVDENGNVNYDNEAFRALAEYVNDNVTYVEQDFDDMYGDIYYEEETSAPAASYTMVSSLITLLYNGGVARDVKLVGLPSIDGRGASIHVDNSIAIAASSPSVEGCRELVNILLSDDIQAMYCSQGSTPVSLAGFRSGCEDSLAYYNSEVERMQGYASYIDMGEMMEMYQPADESVIDAYEDMINNCGSVAFTDPAVVSIVREEMGAYFAGQKTLDEVLQILQDRVNTFTNERG